MTDIEANAGGGTVIIEVGSGPGTEQTGVGSQLAKKTAKAVEHAREAVFLVAQEFIKSVDALEDARRPSELTVQFAIALTATGNAKIATLQSAANFNVTLKYNLTESGTTAK